MYTVYALYSIVFDKLYIGYTANLAARLRSHNELATKGYTVRYRPWTLVYQETFPTKREALQREKELKSAIGRSFLWSIIENKSLRRGSSGS